jgi:hypothetical protein
MNFRKALALSGILELYEYFQSNNSRTDSEERPEDGANPRNKTARANIPADSVWNGFLGGIHPRIRTSPEAGPAERGGTSDSAFQHGACLHQLHAAGVVW